MRVRWLAVLSCLVGVFALGLAACGGDDEESTGGSGSSSSGGISGDSLTIYSSLPLQGTSRAQSEAVIDGEKLALGDERARSASTRSSTCRSTTRPRRTRGTADEAQTAQNARKVVQDESTIVYLGEFNSGGIGDLDPDPEQGGHPADLPVEHLRRPDHGRAGRRAGRAGQVLPDAASAPTRASSPLTRSRVRRW